MKALCTGGLGFLGSHLVDRLVADGHAVTVFDNGSTGFPELANSRATYVKGDILDLSAITAATKGVDTVFHLSANADIKGGWEDPTRDVKQNILATSNVLEAMRANGVKRIAFASSDAVYGESKVVPTPEDCPWPVQTSLYGASKVAGEALVQAYCAGQGFEGYIFRFCPLVGERYTHGHIFDFVRWLINYPDTMFVRGGGRQKKCKIYVKDAVDAVLHVMRRQPTNGPVFNVTAYQPRSVNDSIVWICDEMKVKPKVGVGGELGATYANMLWPDGGKLAATGWQPTVNTEEGVRRTVRWLLNNCWVFERR